MMRPALISAAVCLLPVGAQAFECRFTTECYESEPCATASFEVAVDVEAKTAKTLTLSFSST